MITINNNPVKRSFMFCYYGPDKKVQECSAIEIALRILEDETAEHKVQLGDQSLLPWQQVPEVKEAVSDLQSTFQDQEYFHQNQWHKVLYAGPDIVGECYLAEIIARILEKPNENHLLCNLDIPYATVVEWTPWQNILPLYCTIRSKGVPLPPFVPQKVKVEVITDIRLGEHRERYGLNREGAFERLVQNYDPTLVSKKKSFINTRTLYEWGQLDAEPIWDELVLSYTFNDFRNHLTSILTETGKIVLPKIGVLHYKPDRKEPVVLRMYSSFAAKLNNRMPIDSKHPLGTDGVHNLSIWIPLLCVKNHVIQNSSKLSTLRQYAFAIDSQDPTKGILLAQHFFEMIAYHLWNGDHVSISKFGCFRLRKESRKNTHRSVRFRSYDSLRKALKGETS